MKRENWGKQDYMILLFIIWILAGLILRFVRMGIVNFSDFVFTCLSVPAFMFVYILVAVNLWVLLAMSLLFLVVFPIYELYDFIHIRGMCLSFIFDLLLLSVSYFSDCFPANPFSAYKWLRTGYILDFKNFFDKLYLNQQVAPGTFYDRVLYKHLPIYQEALNKIMLSVLNEDYLCRTRLEKISPEQKMKILNIAESLNKSGLESGYLLTMLHQYFLCPDDIFEAVRKHRSQAIFSNWAKLSVYEYPYEGAEAWQNVLLTYWPNHLGEKRY